MSRPAAAVISEMQACAASVDSTLTIRCMRCNAPLCDPVSLHHHLGPACRGEAETTSPKLSPKNTPEPPPSVQPTVKKEYQL